MSIFQENVKKQPKRNQFDLSYEAKGTTTFGRLTPFYIEDGVLPGDQIQVKTDMMTELAPLLSNLKHMIDVHVDFFYVSYDSVWSNWRDFISGGEEYNQNPTCPYITYDETNKASFKTGTLPDYLGFPVYDKDSTAPIVTGEVQINALPFRAYQHIYNEWYRDQDIVTKIDIERNTDGSSTETSLCPIRYASWEKDLYSSARPTAQKGTPIQFGNFVLQTSSGTAVTDGATTINDSAGLGGKVLRDAGGNPINYENTVQDLREAEALQRFVETMQRGGNRYNEYLNSMWGVQDQDRRLQIPELLYSQDHPLKINEVLTTTNQDNTTTDNNTAGQAYGRATAYANNQGFSFKAPDYGCIIGIVKYSPRPAYFQGLEKRFLRADRLDWYTDHLALIGEDSINERELFLTLTSPATDAATEFGYHHRYYDFKTRNDMVTGDFRYSLKFQHLARELNTQPTLSQNFIEMGNTFDSGLTRIFNVITSTDDYIWFQCYNDALYNRDVAYHTTPLS